MVVVRKRKIGNSDFYYLEHSVKKDGKVVKREKYLGKTIPKNIEELKEDMLQDERKILYEKFERIKKNFQKEWKSIPESVKQKEKEEISIAFTYNTNAIEGSKITLYEAREIIHDKIAPNKQLRDVKETEMHSKVFLEMLDKKDDITNDVLLKWHKHIFGDTKNDIAGIFRNYLVRIGNHIAPDWQDINKLMNQLIFFIKNSKINSVELAALAHYKFEFIHPFGDGNGRIGRLLINHILWHNGYPMLILEYKKRRSYYKALEKGEDAFVKYFIKRYISVHKKRLK